MRTALVTLAALSLLLPVTASAQDQRAALEKIARDMGATTLKSIEYTGSGVNFAVGQSPAPGMPWPRFTVKSYAAVASSRSGASCDRSSS